ncbi:hypothetical protein LAZ67_15002589 [Cordylochernes scorpioides]|uniref:Uncharacterized protein n=1 Tax=Cordylochernes scorpioides TaxID=51811 RepID=A0ABY6LDU5_9ARAC|nr:hypothetical protein LAZ67_15002589 [Cordylochernes scorpioides]
MNLPCIDVVVRKHCRPSWPVTSQLTCDWLEVGAIGQSDTIMFQELEIYYAGLVPPYAKHRLFFPKRLGLGFRFGNWPSRPHDFWRIGLLKWIDFSSEVTIRCKNDFFSCLASSPSLSVVAVNFLEHSVGFSGTSLPVEGEQQNFPQMGTFWLGNHHFPRAPEIFHDLNFSKTPHMLMPHYTVRLKIHPVRLETTQYDSRFTQYDLRLHSTTKDPHIRLKIHPVRLETTQYDSRPTQYDLSTTQDYTVRLKIHTVRLKTHTVGDLEYTILGEVCQVKSWSLMEMVSHGRRCLNKRTVSGFSQHHSTSCFTSFACYGEDTEERKMVASRIERKEIGKLKNNI